MPTDNDTIKVLDLKIIETERLAVEAQRWANRLSQLLNDLAVLKRARDLLLSDEPPGEQQREPIAVFAPSAHTPSPTMLEPQGEDEAQMSIGALVLKILGEAGKPLSVQAILLRMYARGRGEVALKTLGGVISQYFNAGKIRRTARATYALPLASTNGAAMRAD